jgi:TolB-like protein
MAEAEDPANFHQVFISYASSDAAVANALVVGLERQGLRCWIAPRDVSPGDLYADRIIGAINDAKVLVLVLSENAVSSPHVGKEIERASAKRRPIIAVRTDATPLPRNLEYFLSESQWIEMDAGGTDAVSAKLVEAVRRILSRGQGTHPSDPAPLAPFSARKPRMNLPVLALIALVIAAVGYIAVDKLFLSKRSVPPTAVAPAPATATGSAFNPPPHSIAVLPFVNMSGDPKEDYFSDGLSEELLNSLTTIPELRVAARTSSFFFKGKDVDLSDVAHKLNVGAVLEGSVRKDGAQVRITAQLIDAVTGFHIWSHTYDRDLKDILKLQTDIATAVTQALQATLMADAASTMELGGTKNPQAFDAYLRAKDYGRATVNREASLSAIAAYEEAVRLDPHFAKAYASLSLAETGLAEYYGQGAEIREYFNRSRAAAERAVELAPDLGAAHSAMANVLWAGFLDFKGALAEHQKAVALSPNDSGVLLRAAWFFVDMGHTDEGLKLAQRGVSLDQLNPAAYRSLAILSGDARRYQESIEAANRALSLNNDDKRQLALRGLADIGLLDFEAARQSCDTPPLDWEARLCLAIAYDKLHRRADAEAQVAAMKSELADASAYQYAEIYAQWGDKSQALDWLVKAYQLKDPGIGGIKTDVFIDPLRKEPRFLEIEGKLNLPD